MQEEIVVLAFVPDLMDRSRFPPSTIFIRDPAQVAESEEAAGLVIVDLGRCQQIEDFGRVCSSTNVPVVGFVPHVETKASEEAQTAGFSQVFARSVFFKRLPNILNLEFGE